MSNPSPISPARIAVVGSGVSGLSAAWLLSKSAQVTLYEADSRIGGHSHTVETEQTPVDTGFIVYNETNYPNLTALFEHLGVETQPTKMSFSVSVDGGRLEYCSTGLGGLFAQKRNMVSARFWGMLKDMRRFHKTAGAQLPALEADQTSLGEFLSREGYSQAFCEEHLLPQAAAIWSSQIEDMNHYPAAGLIRFYANHDLLGLVSRVNWRTVTGGSRRYVAKLAAAVPDIRTGVAARTIHRDASGVMIRDSNGEVDRFDQVVLAVHADQALAMLETPSEAETRLLSPFKYSRNLAVLHRDERLMPRRRRAWAAWNHLGGEGRSSVTYWMNRLQSLPGDDLFVTLNPFEDPRNGTLVRADVYEHPLFDAGTDRAQKELWSLQGVNRTWFCGAWFGHGFHEDGLQSGLAVAEQLGGVRRPWTVENESGRIHLGSAGEARKAA